MARPKKFRLSPGEVLEPPHARKLAGHVSEIEFFRRQVAELQQQIAGIYDAADEDGFDKKFVRLAVGRRAQDADALATREAAVDAYTAAIAAGLSTRVREENPDHDPETGEIIEVSPDSSAPGVAATGEGSATPPAAPLANTNIAPVVVEGSRSTRGTDVGDDGGAESTAARKDVPRSDELAGPVQLQDGGSPAPQNDPAGGTVEVSAGVESAGVGRFERPEASPRSNGSQAGAQAPPVDTFPPGSIRRERTPAVGIVRHEVQRCFPEAWGMDAASLKDDIRANGIREPILMQGNILLDGWSRFLAARELGIDYPVKEYDGDDPLADIIKANMASRSLNLAERVSIGRKLIKLAPEREADIADLLDLHQERDAA